MSIKTTQVWESLCAFTEKSMTLHQVPGVVFGVLHGGEIQTAAYGVTHVHHLLEVTSDTLFQIGSITKTYTGTALMRLVESGQVDLEATIRTYLPEFQVADEAASAQATVRHLLTHTGGWVGDFFHDTGAGDDAAARYVRAMADLEQLAPLGSVWSYNNSGFEVAGHIMEQVTGKSYQAALHELLLEPLGLEHTFFDPGDVMTRRFAVGHELTDDNIEVAEPWPLPRSAYPAGGITCSVHDLLTYGRFQLGDGTTVDGTRLLQSESLQLMQTPQVTMWGEESWGLSWYIDDTYGTRILGHGGGTNGQISGFTFVPEHGFALAVFTNANRGGSVVDEVTRQALQQYLGLELKDPTPIESTEEDLLPYVGRYERPFADIEIGLLGSRLVAQMTYKGGFPSQDSPPPPPPPPASLALCGRDELLVMDGPFQKAQLHFIRQEDGTIGWLRASSRLHVRQD